MRCPVCADEVPARPVCLRCGASLFGNPSLPASALGPVAVPLTAAQRARLLARLLPLVMFALLVAAYLGLVARAILPAPQPLFLLFIGAVTLVTGYGAAQGLRDLASGVALVQEDLLHRSWRSRSGARGRHYGRFEKLGTLRMTRRAHFGNSAGHRYRVIYSPASKIVWALEPPEQRLWR